MKVMLYFLNSVCQCRLAHSVYKHRVYTEVTAVGRGHIHHNTVVPNTEELTPS